MAREPDWALLAGRIDGYRCRLCSAIAAWETMAALCHSYGVPPAQARERTRAILATSGFVFVAIGEREYELAAEAFARFGKGRHKAALNMGDCYAYACAQANQAPLLFKGGDFALTDIAPA